MKILVVSQYYFPENFQINTICEELVKKGNSVTVFTGLPNYPSGKIPKEYKHNKKNNEIINGVKVIRNKEIGRKKGPLFLALNYFSYAFNASRKVNKLENDFDIVFVYQLSPVFMAFPAIKYSKKYNVPLYLYCLDLWPESLKMYIKNEKNIIFKLVKKISKSIYSACDRIAVQSKSFIQYFINTIGIKKENIYYLPSFANDDYLKLKYKEKNDIVNFVFLGNLGIAQNLFSILKALKYVKNRNFVMHFVGDGCCLDEMKKNVLNTNLEKNVVFYGRRPKEEMLKFYNLADVCVVSLKSDNYTGMTIPAKIQEYMAASKPIIGMIDGPTKDIILEANCGLCSLPNDFIEFAKNMDNFIDNRFSLKKMGENGRSYFINNFSKTIYMDKLEEEFLNIHKKMEDN